MTDIQRSKTSTALGCKSNAEQCSSPLARMLKIEAEGDHWTGRIKPRIRLGGRWLERAGFIPDHRVQVTCVSHGIIELRSPDAMLMDGSTQTSSEQTKQFIPSAEVKNTLITVRGNSS